MENHHFKWVNPLFRLGHGFNSYFDITRGYKNSTLVMPLEVLHTIHARERGTEACGTSPTSHELTGRIKKTATDESRCIMPRGNEM